MFTASQKKRDNIAEYLLYMWNIEDIIRANHLDIGKIEENIIKKYSSLSPEEIKQLKEWYESLIDMMKREGVSEKGHLQLNKNVLIQLNDLHRRLLADQKFADYAAEFYKTLPFIVELRAKSGDNRTDEIETSFNALYGLMLLRLAGKEISAETALAAKQISRFLAVLSHYYKKIITTNSNSQNNASSCDRRKWAIGTDSSGGLELNDSRRVVKYKRRSTVGFYLY